jgi:dihydrodipicolinate synthase/N-acetylneuraminate lyase
MHRNELKALIVGPVVTVPTPFDDRFDVDFGLMAERTRFWVASGLVAGKAVIKVAAAMGEGPMLREWEWPALLRATTRAAEGKAAIVCGIQHKDTLRTIEDIRQAQDLGAIGVQVAPPIFNDPTQDDILRFFDAISQAIDIGVIIYNQPWYPHGAILPETFMRMKDFEHIVAIKWATLPGVAYDEVARLTPIFNIIDNTLEPVRCHKLGGRGFITDTAMAYPAHDLRIWELMESGRHDEAQALYEPVNRTLREFYSKLAAESGGQGRLTKALMQVMGIPMGASRPPTLPLSAAQLAELRQILIGFGWPVPA